jgi:hypothetical protein
MTKRKGKEEPKVKEESSPEARASAQQKQAPSQGAQIGSVTYDVVSKELGITTQEFESYSAQGQQTLISLAYYKSLKDKYPDTARRKATLARIMIKDATDKGKIQDKFGDIIAQAPKPKLFITVSGAVVADGYYLGEKDDPSTWERAKEIGAE